MGYSTFYTVKSVNLFLYDLFSLSFLNRIFFSATPSGRHAGSSGIELTPPAVGAQSLNHSHEGSPYDLFS